MRTDVVGCTTRVEHWISAVISKMKGFFRASSCIDLKSFISLYMARSNQILLNVVHMNSFTDYVQWQLALIMKNNQSKVEVTKYQSMALVHK